MARSWERRSRAAATIFMARVIFSVLLTDLIRVRIAFSDAICQVPFSAASSKIPQNRARSPASVGQEGG